MHNDAVSLAQLGYYILATNPDKTPVPLNGVKGATLDLNAIRFWYEQQDFSYGLAIAGGPSNLLIVDIDNKNDEAGLRNWTEICNTYGISDSMSFKTPIVRTKSGGYHIYFKGAVEEPVRSLAQYVDIKTTGGYVCCPPTPGYVWEISIFDEDPIEPPEWLPVLCRSLKKSTEFDEPVKTSIEHGERHNVSVAMIGLLRRLGFEPETIFEAVYAMMTVLCPTGFDERALRRRCHSSRNWRPRARSVDSRWDQFFSGREG